MIKNLVIFGDMLDDAYLSGLITEEEYVLLNNISVNYGIYERNLDEAVNDGIITDGEAEKLRKIRKHIYENALRTSLKKGIITSEEKIVLNTLRKSVGLNDKTLAMIEGTVRRETRFYMDLGSGQKCIIAPHRNI